MASMLQELASPRTRPPTPTIDRYVRSHRVARSLCLAATLLMSVAAVGGCREKDTGPKTTTITDGRIKKITGNPDGTGKIVVTYRHEKTGVEMDGEADVVATTTILIGGQPAKLAALEVGQRVDGEVLIEKTGKITKLTASRISVQEAAKSASTGDAPAGNAPAGDGSPGT